MTILALDPGATTGYVFEVADEVKDFGECELEDVWGLLEDYYDRSAKQYREQLVVVMESFQYRKQQLHVVLAPVEVIGVVKEFCRQFGITLYLQMASQAKSYWTDDRLKLMHMWFKGQQHARDAARHLLYYRYFGKGKGSYGPVPC